MTKDGKKTGIMVGAAALIAGVIYAMSKKPKEGEGGTVVIEILDANGNPVPKKSPASLVEGTNYTIRVTVANRSTRGGIAQEADLTLSVHVTLGGMTFINGLSDGLLSHRFAADSSYAFTWPLMVPVGYFNTGTTGLVDARVISPDGTVLATAQEPLTLQILDIIYKATIVIGV